MTTGTEQTGGLATNRVAVFIDVDNVLILSRDSILPFRLSLIIDRVRQQGSIMSAKAYADWSSTLLVPYKRDFESSAIEQVQLSTSGVSREHKNTADIQLAVDALEMVFSPVRPDTIVIVGGDRDYVPLVQKLKRYGVFVMGIGVEAGVSRMLTEACNSFVYYNDLVPPAPDEAAEPASLPDPQEAYSLMVRAIGALDRDGRRTTGTSVHGMMKQMAPTFNIARYKTTFRGLAEEAAKAGYVEVTDTPGLDLELTLGPNADSRPSSAPEAIARELDFSPTEAIMSSYRAILQDRRIPLMPWSIRERFVRLVWNSLDDRGGYGLSLDGMRNFLLEDAAAGRLPVTEQMIRKLLYTLNLARCFSTQHNANFGRIAHVPDEVHHPLFPVTDIEGAIDAMHRNYLRLLAGGGAVLYPDAVFALLYGDDIADGEAERRRAALEAMCHEIKPMGLPGQALADATRRG